MGKRKGLESDSGAESAPTFEQSLQELQSIVSQLEEGTISLGESLQQFERGIVLLRGCYSVLEAAEAKVEILTRFQGDQPLLTPFDNAATFIPDAGVATRSPQPGAVEQFDDSDDSGKPSLF
jgi:exodeoxyribonuclease VII small subunit